MIYVDVVLITFLRANLKTKAKPPQKTLNLIMRRFIGILGKNKICNVVVKSNLKYCLLQAISLCLRLMILPTIENNTF